MLQLKTKMEGKTMYLRIMTLFQFMKNNISQKKHISFVTGEKQR